jgi:hypothetical protein
MTTAVLIGFPRIVTRPSAAPPLIARSSYTVIYTLTRWPLAFEDFCKGCYEVFLLQL